MKRVGIGFAVIFVLIFAVLSISKLRSSGGADIEEIDAASVARRGQVLRFWEIYRQATEHRTAGRLEDAARDYARAVELNSEHEDALYYLGSMQLELGEFSAAERSWRRLVEVNPLSARGHSRLGQLHSCAERPELLDLDQAKREFERALELNKEESGPLLQLGRIALVAGDTADARRLFDQVIGSNYSSVDAHFLKGYIAWKGGDRGTAASLFAEAVRYAQPVVPSESVLSEGDTKSGSRPMVLSSSRCRGVQAYSDELRGLNEDALDTQMNVHYRQLDEFLQAARAALNALGPESSDREP